MGIKPRSTPRADADADADAGFSGFGPATWDWFAGLEDDNSRDYFEARRDDFERSVKRPMAALLDAAAREFDGRVKLFRQHRDTRFSPNKAPYKTNTYGVVLDRPGTETALYASVSRTGLAAATGYYQMAKDQLQRFRDAVTDDKTGPQLVRIVAALRERAEVWGATLKTAPRGYPRDHERVELLRHTSVIASVRFDAGDERLHSAAILAPIFDHWRRAAPLARWLDRCVGASEEPPESRWRR